MKMQQRETTQQSMGRTSARGSATSAVHSFRLPPSALRLRPAFTLVELLVAITIMAILAALILFAVAAAEETGRYAKTQGTITKLHSLIMDKYDSYRTRRLPISIPPGTNPIPAAITRLNALRELMRMEMPDRWTDVDDDPVTLLARPAVSRAYLRALKQRYASLPSLGDALFTHQGAECLYLFVSLGSDDPDVMEQFSPNEVADTDGDGFLEFIDGWQQPISFLRWAPGFPSPLQLGIPYSGSEHDPFDPLRVYKSANTDFPNGVYPPLTPLIYSAGPDKSLGLQADNNPPSGPSTPFRYKSTSPPNNPYQRAIGDGQFIGTPSPSTDTYIDNITNHIIEAR